MAELPLTRSAFDKTWPTFSKWLVEHGSAILKPTNKYEAARFLTDVGTGVVYANRKGEITHWSNNADAAFLAYKAGTPWRAIDAIVRSKKTRREYEALVARDGNGCMYCAAPLSIDSATIEHVVPVTSGGPNHLANKALACEPCNRKAGNLSAREKLEMAIRIRSRSAAA